MKYFSMCIFFNADVGHQFDRKYFGMSIMSIKLMLSFFLNLEYPISMCSLLRPNNECNYHSYIKKKLKNCEHILM